MSLLTRCPRCRTLFRVTPVQLQAAAGKVRCGRCTNVFDGYEALSAGGPPAKSETSAAATTVTAIPVEEAERVTTTRSRLNAKWAAVIALLVFTLTLQVAYAFRAQFAARSPELRGTMENVCEFVGCVVALPQRPDLLRIEASDVHMIDPNRPSLIQVTATLRSYAKHDVAYPALDLVLTNANEHALARRVFLPDEYVGAGRNPKAGIPPNGEVTVAIDVETGDVNAAGFRLDLLAAPSR